VIVYFQLFAMWFELLYDIKINYILLSHKLIKQAFMPSTEAIYLQIFYKIYSHFYTFVTILRRAKKQDCDDIYKETSIL